MTPTFMYTGAQAALIRMGRASRDKHRAQSELVAALKPHLWTFDEQHQSGIARSEAALRNGTMRALPSVFREEDGIEPRDEDMDVGNDEAVICAACNGSGEGQYEGQTCSTCRGKGEIA
jgi:hypothetical protein